MTECNKRVLIVDDDSSVLRLYSQLLGIEQAGGQESDILSDLMTLVDEEVTEQSRSDQCDVVMVSQGDAAVVEVRSALEADNPFQLLFLDMRLPPGMDGKETALQIRALQPQLPIVFVTAFSDHSEKELMDALPSAPVYFNYKPFARTELEAAIQKFAL